MFPSKKKRIQQTVIVFAVFCLIPLAVGLGLDFGLHDHKYTETLFAGFALLALLWILIRARLLDKKLYKEGKPRSEFKRTEEYADYRYLQIVILLAVAVDVIASLIAFFTMTYGKY